MNQMTQKIPTQKARNKATEQWSITVWENRDLSDSAQI